MAGRKALEVYLDLLSQPCEFTAGWATTLQNTLVRWHHTNTPPHATKVFIMEVLLPRMTGALADLGDTLEKLENMFLKRQPFLCGDDISLANLLAVCELMQVALDILKDRPKLLSWKSRVQWGTLDKAHTVLYRLWDRSNAKQRSSEYSLI
uniref:GST C-terminal domain-containing protein n=1 Tax=Oncorhynchus mykiss TaxID=8022 RepID=A0A8C7LYL6_ONCMY